MGYHLKPPHSHIFTNFAISLFTLYTVPHIHFITCFYVRWLRLHPHLVFVISFSHYQAVCVSAFPRSTLPVYYFLLALPIICFYPNIVLASVPYFHSVIFPLSFQFSPHIMMGYVILFLKFHRSSADFMSIWSLLVLVMLPN